MGLPLGTERKFTVSLPCSPESRYTPRTSALGRPYIILLRSEIKPLGDIVTLIGLAAASSTRCLIATFTLRPGADALDKSDLPGYRNPVEGKIPVLGGLGVPLGIVLGMSLLRLPDRTSGILLSAAMMFIAIGLLD